MPKYFHIAIDGPVAAGKSTIARQLAERLGFVYIDTGAMYRAVTLLAHRNQVSVDDGASLVKLMHQATIKVRQPLPGENHGRLSTVLLNDEDVSQEIRTHSIDLDVPRVSAQAVVRAKLVEKQQQAAINKNVVMEGRDITYRVLPNANLKIFLTASDEERVRRRYQQLTNQGTDISLEQVKIDLQERDYRDKNRVTDPLKIVADAWVLDTTQFSIEEVVEKIADKVQELGFQL